MSSTQHELNFPLSRHETDRAQYQYSFPRFFIVYSFSAGRLASEYVFYDSDKCQWRFGDSGAPSTDCHDLLAYLHAYAQFCSHGFRHRIPGGFCDSDGPAIWRWCVRFPVIPLSCNVYGQAVHTHAPLSPSSGNIHAAD